MKSASFSIAILNFFFSAWSIFSSYKRSDPNETDFNLFCTFAIILDKFSAPTSSNFFLWKIWVITNSKYHLVSLLNEKQGSTFANFLDLFYPLTLLTHSALLSYLFWACFLTNLTLQMPEQGSWTSKLYLLCLIFKGQCGSHKVKEVSSNCWIFLSC